MKAGAICLVARNGMGKAKYSTVLSKIEHKRPRCVVFALAREASICYRTQEQCMAATVRIGRHLGPKETGDTNN